MRNLIWLLIFIFALVNQNMFSQNIEFVCEHNETIEPREITDRGGLFITSQGTIRIPFVFIQLKDDNHPSSEWSLDSLPSWA